MDTPPPSLRVSGIILAGGQSRRFGADKALLPLGGRPLIAHTVGKLVALSDDLLVVTNRANVYAELSLPARLISDERPGEGALMGIYSGLKAARHARAVVVACDMPFLDLSLLRHMLELADEHDVVIPKLRGLCEPLHAVYTRACVEPIARVLARGERQIIAFLPEVRVRYVTEREVDLFDPQRLSFVNVNTPEDWAEVRRRLEPHDPSDEGSGTLSTPLT